MAHASTKIDEQRATLDLICGLGKNVALNHD